MIDLDGERLHSDLQKIKPSEGCFYSAYADLNDFLNHFMFECAREYRDLKDGLKNEITFERKLLVLQGPPKVGKTWDLEKVRRVLGRSVKIWGGRESDIGEVTWEENGEERARAKGKITTPRDQVLEAEELEASTQEISEAISESILENKVTAVELPGGATATLLPDHSWKGRQLGAEVVYNLVNRTGAFRDLPDFEVYHVGQFGGPLLQLVTGPFREDYRNAPNFREAQRIARLYGQPIPHSRNEWERVRVTGASELQVKEINNHINQLVAVLELKGLIKNPFLEHSSLINALVAESLNYTLDLEGAIERKESVRAVAINLILEDFFTRVLEIDRNHAFIGYNNPTYEDLGIPNIHLLSAHVNGRGRFRLSA